MIRASIYGRLGGDPVERQTRAGKTFTTASLAVNVARPGDDDDTEWFDLAAFGRQADELMRHAKGELVAVMGSLTRRRYTGRDGNERESWSLTVESILSARTVRPGGGRKRTSNTDQPTDAQPASAAPGAGDFDDDIPF